MYLWWALSAVAGLGFYYFSKTIQFYVKYGVFLACLLSVSTIVVAKSLLTCSGKTTKNYRFFIWGCRKVSSIYGWTYTIKGKEYVQADGPIIAISNHQSGLDLIILSELCENDKFPNTLVAKHTLMYYGIFGVAQFLCNTLMINRKNLSRAIKQMKSITEEIKAKQLKVYIFPEGRRNNSGRFLPFKKGAFHIAIDAQVPIVPVVISSLKPFYDKDSKCFESGHITVTCLPPVSTTGLSKEDIPCLIESTRSSMIETYERTSAASDQNERKIK